MEKTFNNKPSSWTCSRKLSMEFLFLSQETEKKRNILQTVVESTLFSSQRCLTPINISDIEKNIPNMQPPISTKKTPPKLLISKANAPASELVALDLKNLVGMVNAK